MVDEGLHLVCHGIRLQHSEEWPVVRWVRELRTGRIVAAQIKNADGNLWRMPELMEWQLIDAAFPSNDFPGSTVRARRRPIWAEANPRSRESLDAMRSRTASQLTEQQKADQLLEAKRGMTELWAERRTNPIVVFGRYRISLARDLLGLSLEEIAARYDVSVHTWRSYEDGSIMIPDHRLKALEDDVKSELATVGFAFAEGDANPSEAHSNRQDSFI